MSCKLALGALLADKLLSQLAQDQLHLDKDWREDDLVRDAKSFDLGCRFG